MRSAFSRWSLWLPLVVIGTATRGVGAPRVARHPARGANTRAAAVSHPVQRDAAVAPFVLSLVGFDGARWSLRDHLGQQSVLLLFPGAGFQLLDARALQALNEAAQTLRFKQSTTVLVPSPSDAKTAATFAETSSVPVLLDDTASLRRLFGLDARQAAMVSIDRAGFLRGVQILPADSWGALTRVLAQAADPTPPLEEGQAAPDFVVRDMNGKVQRLRDSRGHNLLLTFFPKCFTGGCRSHLSSLRDYGAQLEAANTRVLAVSVDAAGGAKGQKAFAANLKLPFPLIPDTGRNLSILYGAANSPQQMASRMSVLIDRNGVVRWIDRSIDVKTHGTDVLAKIRSLGLDRANAAE